MGTEIDDEQSWKKNLDADLGNLSTSLDAEKLCLGGEDSIEDGEKNRCRRLDGADKGAEQAARHCVDVEAYVFCWLVETSRCWKDDLCRMLRGRRSGFMSDMTLADPSVCYEVRAWELRQ